MRMKRIVGILLSISLAVFLVAAPGFALTISPGDRVELQAESTLGVPLHETASPSLIGRAPDGLIVEVVDTADDQRWIEIKLPDGDERWIVQRYISQIVAPSDEEIAGREETENAEDEGSRPVILPTDAILPELTGEALRSRLAIDYQVRTSLGYRQARDYMYSQLDNENGVVRGIYSDFAVRVNPNSSRPRSDAFQDGRGINAEHSWPQSKGATGIAKSDLHHLFPTRVRVNGRRGSLPFADIDDQQTEKWILNDQELPSIPTVNIDAYSESTRRAFEPRESVKGNIARALFYFYTVYPKQADPDFFQQQQETLCAWNVADPVDAAEVARSHAIATQQGNENPFVLDSTLAERLYCPR